MSMLEHAARTYRCPICQKRITAAESVYSRRTGNHYCTDLRTCRGRRDRNRKKA